MFFARKTIRLNDIPVRRICNVQPFRTSWDSGTRHDYSGRFQADKYAFMGRMFSAQPYDGGCAGRGVTCSIMKRYGEKNACDLQGIKKRDKVWHPAALISCTPIMELLFNVPAYCIEISISSIEASRSDAWATGWSPLWDVAFSSQDRCSDLFFIASKDVRKIHTDSLRGDLTGQFDLP